MVHQHYLLSAASRGLSRARIAEMTNDEAYEEFKAIRFNSSGGRPVCPRCECDAIYEIRTRQKFKCKRCDHQFSVTSGTPFASHKLSFKKLLEVVASFIIPSAGRSAVELSHDLDISYKTAFVLARKMREAMQRCESDLQFDGMIEIDGAAVGGKVRPPNVKKTKKDHRKWPYRAPERKQVVVVIRQRNGRTKTVVVDHERHSLPTVLNAVARSAKVYADSAACWNMLAAYFEMARINHEVAYATPEACTNFAESFFSVLRRAEFGRYHRIAGPYLNTYAEELVFRQDHRRCSVKEKYDIVMRAMTEVRPSKWKGYFQGKAPGMVRP